MPEPDTPVTTVSAPERDVDVDALQVVLAGADDLDAGRVHAGSASVDRPGTRTRDGPGPDEPPSIPALTADESARARFFGAETRTLVFRRAGPGAWPLCPQGGALVFRPRLEAEPRVVVRDEDQPGRPLERPRRRVAVADLDAVGDHRAGADDGAPDLRVAADVAAVQQDAVLHLRAALDDHPAADDRVGDDPAAHEGAVADEAAERLPGTAGLVEGDLRGPELGRRRGQRPRMD